jgi:hypothetical protein
MCCTRNQGAAAVVELDRHHRMLIVT